MIRRWLDLADRVIGRRAPARASDSPIPDAGKLGGERARRDHDPRPEPTPRGDRDDPA